MKSSIWVLNIFLLFVSACILFLLLAPTQVSNKLGYGYGPAKLTYNAIGTPSAPVNLSTSYNTNSTTLRVGYFDTLQLDLIYESVTTTTFASVLVEVSNDGGTTYYPITTVSSTQTETVAFSNGTNGIPVIFPGEKTTATGTPYYGAVVLKDIAGDFIRVSAKNSGSTTSTLSVTASVISK